MRFQISDTNAGIKYHLNSDELVAKKYHQGICQMFHTTAERSAGTVIVADKEMNYLGYQRP